MADPRWLPRFPRLPAVVASILAIITGMTARTQLDAAFSAMHVPGHAGGSFTGIDGPTSLWSADPAQQSIQGWYAWQSTQLGVAHNIRVAPATWIAASIDVLLIAVPAALLILFAARATARRFPVPQTSDVAAESDLSALARFAARRRWPITIVVAGLLRAVLAACAITVEHGDDPWLLRSAGLSAVVFYAAIGLPAFAMAYAHIAGDLGMPARPHTQPTHGLRRIGRVMVALRCQIIAAALLPILLVTLGGGLGQQIDDLALRWTTEWWTLVAAVVTALALNQLIRVTGAASWYSYRTLPPTPTTPSSGRWAVITGAVLLAGYGVSFAWPPAWGVLLWPGLCLLAIGMITRIERPTRHPAPPEPPADVDDTRWALRTADVLAVVPLASLGIIAINAGAQLLVARGEIGSAGTAFLGGAVAVLIACGWLVSRPRPTPPTWMRYAAYAAVAIFVTVAIGCVVDPIWFGQHLGALAVLISFSGILLGILVFFVWLFRHRRPSGPVGLLRVRRMPVLTFGLIWLVVTAAVQSTDHYHDTRLLPASAGRPAPVTPATAVSQWLDAYAGRPPVPPPAGTRTSVPMVFVASLGGGARAAYWTNLVLDCLFDPGAEPAGTASTCAGTSLDEARVFAESGVSGGAVGIALHRALGGQAFSPVLSDDFVSPDIAAMAFRDAPSTWLPVPLQSAGHDRAAVLEQAWERASGGAMAEGLYASAYAADGTVRFPIDVLGSAAVDDGCRINVSVLRAAGAGSNGTNSGCYTLSPFAPAPTNAAGSPIAGTADGPALAGTKDIYDYLCAPGSPGERHDLSLSSAALLAARFPYVSPTGGLTGCGTPQHRTFAMDGGVLDNSGASALAELWSSTAGQIADFNANVANSTCVEPRLLIIDNGYADPAPVAEPAQPQELLAPLGGRNAVTAAQTQVDEQRAALAFQQAFGAVGCPTSTGHQAPASVPSRIAIVQPSARPGPFAPLGWSLSTYAEADLVDQLGSSPNACEMAVVRDWFGGLAIGPFAAGGACDGLTMTSASGPIS